MTIKPKTIWIEFEADDLFELACALETGMNSNVSTFFEAVKKAYDKPNELNVDYMEHLLSDVKSCSRMLEAVNKIRRDQEDNTNETTNKRTTGKAKG